RDGIIKMTVSGDMAASLDNSSRQVLSAVSSKLFFAEASSATKSRATPIFSKNFRIDGDDSSVNDAVRYNALCFCSHCRTLLLAERFALHCDCMSQSDFCKR